MYFSTFPTGTGFSSRGDYAMCDAWDRREALVRERSVLYAKKYLGRLLRKIPD